MPSATQLAGLLNAQPQAAEATGTDGRGGRIRRMPRLQYAQQLCSAKRPDGATECVAATAGAGAEGSPPKRLPQRQLGDDVRPDAMRNQK